MLEFFFKVSPIKLTLGISLVVFSFHISVRAADSQTNFAEPNSSLPEIRAAGLELGNELTHVTLKGHVHMQCEDYLVAADSEFDCTMDTLEPFTFSRFQTIESIDADHFDLQIQHEKSWARSKSGSYLPSSGSSALSLNLWNSSLFDWPILDDGVNLATFSLTKAGKPVATGSFTVNVSKVARSCSPATLVSNDDGDCRNKKYACDRYFFQNGHCLAP